MLTWVCLETQTYRHIDDNNNIETYYTGTHIWRHRCIHREKEKERKKQRNKRLWGN